MFEIGIKKLQKGEGWQPHEILFIQKNFFSMTNQQMCDWINDNRNKSSQLTTSAVIHRCRTLGLKRGIQIRWDFEDIERLMFWFPLMGNTEIAQLLNEYGTTKRNFTKKHIEKKMVLLGLKRTDEQLLRIRENNQICGCFVHKVWETRPVAKEEDTRIWNCNGKRYRQIKINGKFIPYTRWFYNNFIEKLNKTDIVFHLDFDSLNDVPENLEKREKRRKSSAEDYKKAIKLLQTRLTKLQRVNMSSMIGENKRKEHMQELIRVQNLISKLTKKLK